MPGRSGPLTKDTTTIALGLAQIRVGASATNIASTVPRLVHHRQSLYYQHEFGEFFCVLGCEDNGVAFGFAPFGKPDTHFSRAKNSSSH